jgi:hypothetical protein
MTALKKQFKEVVIGGMEERFDLREVHATTVRGKEVAVLLRGDQVVKAINRKSDKTESLKEEQKEEIIRKISMKEMFQEKKKGLHYFYLDSRREELKRNQTPLYFIKTFLRVPSGCNWGLYKWDVLISKEGVIENVTFLFKHMTSHREGYELHYDSALKEALERRGYKTEREL